MKIKREEFLNALNMVRAGLSAREFIEQSSCFVFQSGMVMTFNDEIACRKEIGLSITGAVQASALLAILEKIPDDDLKVRENEDNELEFRGKGRGFAVTKDAEVFLPIDRVEQPEEKKWKPLPKSFIPSINLVQHCAGTDESKFSLTCIHLHPDHIEASDNFQIMRCNVNTGLKEAVLVRSSSIKHIVALSMDEMAITKSWIHFRNKDGLIFSCRRYVEEYPVLDALMKFKGHPIGIPKGLADASERASVFATDKSGDPTVNVSIREGAIKIVGEGLSGWYKEIRKATYDGPPLEFIISPTLLHHIAENYTNARINENRLKVTSDDEKEQWEYVTVLGKPQEDDTEDYSETSDEDEGQSEGGEEE